ncbi:PfkB family carbohydrate kinase [Leucobacter sp. gxy201]|uniref:PfkB family carbohydrate kinase n=1 Tax=Leucobacter sp. gxy201 TaxID=2957200 RepID=UPI003DA06088
MNDAAVCVVGSLNADRYLGLTRLPEPGETIIGEALGLYPGGKGLNQAVAAARCGAATRMCGAIGDDAEGRFLVGAMREAGVDDSAVAVQAGPSGIAHIMSLAAGENSIIVIPGANARVDAGAATRGIAGARVVLVQLEINIGAAAEALEAGRAAGATTVLNAAPAHEAVLGLLPNVDILIVNDSELAMLGGLETLAPLVTVVHTQGGDGLTVHPLGAESFSVGAFPIEVVDTTGAGDAFCGGFVAALAAGESLEAAAKRGAAAGAIVACHRGAQTEALSAEVVSELVGF